MSSREIAPKGWALAVSGVKATDRMPTPMRTGLPQRPLESGRLETGQDGPGDDRGRRGQDDQIA